MITTGAPPGPGDVLQEDVTDKDLYQAGINSKEYTVIQTYNNGKSTIVKRAPGGSTAIEYKRETSHPDHEQKHNTTQNVIRCWKASSHGENKYIVNMNTV